ncbi:MAG: FAD-dependent monooxygenase [bacterium]|nr:FAD-dependent monooxygenase [bacterium]
MNDDETRRDRSAAGPDRWRIVIVGGGPAGASAAIRLAQVAPELAPRTLILDRADFPRDKPCGGGIARITEDLLDMVDVRVDVPSVWIDELRFLHPAGESDYRRASAFRIVRRRDFDAALLAVARSLGVTVHEGEEVRRLARERDGIRIDTDRATYRADVIVGADGARSRVRRTFVSPHAGATFVALETTAPDARAASGAQGATAVFDFRAVPAGLHGYAWDFPCIRDGVRSINCGVGGIRWTPGRAPGTQLEERLATRGLAFARRHAEGAAVPLYHPASEQSAPRVLLAGDAVGIDPLMGEGISVAVATGFMAGHAAARAVASGDFAFADHARRIAGSPVGERLRRNWMIGPHFYERLRDGHALTIPQDGFV